MATTKDAKFDTPKDESPLKVIFSFTLFYVHMFIWLIVIACFGIIAEF